MQILHPYGEQGNLFHLLFCHIARRPFHKGICQHDVKKAAVVSHIEYRLVVGNVFTPLYDQLCAGKERHAAERPVDDGEGAAAFDIHIEFADDPLRQHERHGKDQKQHDKGCGNQKTNHGKSPLYYLKFLSHYTKALRRAQGLAEYDRFIQIFGLDDDVGVGGGGSGAILGSRP